MDTTPTATPSASRSRSRLRSIPNLDKLSIAPLSTNFSLPPDNSASDDDPSTPHASYIQGKSAPTTPGILSLSQSRSSSHSRRHRNTKPFAHDGYFTTSHTNPPSPTYADGPLSKTKSTSALTLPAENLTLDSHGRMSKPSTTLHPRQSKPHHKRSHTASAISSDWLYRAGLAIASETREQKGQMWLASRASSTSLVAISSDPDNDSHARSLDAILKKEAENHEPVTPRWSRVGSRAASARNSRRGSQAGSRADLKAMTPGSRTPTGSYYDSPVFAGPDFVDALESELAARRDGEDEKEIALWTREQSLGLGGWVDRLVGWTLFRVTEDGEEGTETEDDEERDAEEEDRRRRQELEALRRRKDRELINAASAKAGNAGAQANEVEGNKVDNITIKPAQEGEGGWKDAAWLLSVATKVLL